MHEHQQIQQSKNPEPSSQRKTISTKQTNISNTATIIQRVRINPKSLTPADVLQLQRTIGNRAVGRLLSEIRRPLMVQQMPIQRQELEEEEACPSCVQKQEIPEEEPLQGKISETIQRLEPEEEEKLQMKSVVQRQEIPEEDEPLQGKMIGTVQCQSPEEEEPFQMKRENDTGMPDNLKTGVESLSGIDMSDVRVHYNSSKSAEIGALAYTEGTDIHVAPGQERHLPHEAWHVVQQAQGRTKSVIQNKNFDINNDTSLGKKVDFMGVTNGNRVIQCLKEMTLPIEEYGNNYSEDAYFYRINHPEITYFQNIAKFHFAKRPPLPGISVQRGSGKIHEPITSASTGTAHYVEDESSGGSMRVNTSHSEHLAIDDLKPEFNMPFEQNFLKESIVDWVYTERPACHDVYSYGLGGHRLAKGCLTEIKEIENLQRERRWDGAAKGQEPYGLREDLEITVYTTFTNPDTAAKDIQKAVIDKRRATMQMKKIYLQDKFENKSEQAICPSSSTTPILQRQELKKKEKPIEGKIIGAVQRLEVSKDKESTQLNKNNTGMSDNLKAGVENLSGIDMSDVRVHYNSSKPAKVEALAYTQGTNIHVAPGQERHLPHEAWHVVQQMQGRVRPTLQLKDGVQVNDDEGLEREADVMGAKAKEDYGKAIDQQERTGSSVIKLPMQRRVKLNNASDFECWDGEELNSESEELEDVVEELKDNFDWNLDLVGEFGKLINAAALYIFRDFDHLNDFVGGNSCDPPSVEEDEGDAMMIDTFAKEFGSSFKGPHIPFSGSRVYAVGRRGGVDQKIWATQNSATGQIPSKYQSVVKHWDVGLPMQVYLEQLTFPSNTMRAFTDAKIGRPSTMASNAHAEVNQYVQLALFAAAHKYNPADIGLTIGSDIAHCAECYWALAALAAKGSGTFSSFTGCENKLFARWREPWEGFYSTYGPNPFRNADGSFKRNILTKTDFGVGTYKADELNAVSPFKIYK